MNIRKFLNQPFPFLDSHRNRWILIIFCLIFSVFFVNVFVPFNINRWNKDSGFEEFLSLSGFGLISAWVLLFSQFVLRRIFGITRFKVWTFGIWVAGELFLMAVVLLFYQSGWNFDFSRFLKDIPDSYKYTLLGALIPYSLGLLVLSLLMQRSRLNLMSKEKEKTISDTSLFDFPDEKGNIRFSIAGNHIFYIESADNYVIVYYKSGQKIEKQYLRNSMKNIEQIFQNTLLKRCHRSFIVNLDKIEFVEYERAKCRLKLQDFDNFIPVSRKFYPSFQKFTN